MYIGRTAYLLDTQVPLREGEKHCSFCLGYGAHPIPKSDPNKTYFEHPKCTSCEGTGKHKTMSRA